MVACCDVCVHLRKWKLSVLTHNNVTSYPWYSNTSFCSVLCSSSLKRRSSACNMFFSSNSQQWPASHLQHLTVVHRLLNHTHTTAKPVTTLDTHSCTTACVSVGTDVTSVFSSWDDASVKLRTNYSLRLKNANLQRAEQVDKTFMSSFCKLHGSNKFQQ